MFFKLVDHCIDINITIALFLVERKIGSNIAATDIVIDKVEDCFVFYNAIAALDALLWIEEGH